MQIIKEFRKCKFEKCVYKHEKVINDPGEIIKAIESEANKIESVTKTLEQRTNDKSIANKLEAMEKGFEEKIEALTEHLKKMTKLMDDKDFVISSLKKGFKDMEKKLEKQENKKINISKTKLQT